jgi:hypothetical protein
MLCHFVDIVAQGQKTDKGFKDVHLNQVARMVTTFSGRMCLGTEVYNHLRSWRARWVKVCKLKQMSGAGWDEDNFMIWSCEGLLHLSLHFELTLIFATRDLDLTLMLPAFAFVFAD